MAVARSKLTVVSRIEERGVVQSDGFVRRHARVGSPAEKNASSLVPSSLYTFASLFRSSSSSRLSSSSPAYLLCSSAPTTPVGRYAAIGHSWPGSMMLAARA